MANQYKNKVIYGNQTLIDITDTTATESDVLEGEVFYTANGAKGVGTLGDVTTSTHGLMSAADKTKLNGIATGAEVNQNAFSNVTVGNTTIAADAKTDTLTLVAGSNVTLTPDATNDKITITATDTNTWRPVSDSVSSTSSSDAASSKAVKTAYDLAASKTSNTGTITGITMNGASKGTSGVVDLGTVLTAHQDISGKADKSSTVSNVAYDSTNKKITKTINGTTSDVVTAATLKTAMSLGNVENKSSATIRGEITSSNVTTALGFTPMNASLKGANNGVAELDSAGKVPANQLPSYVDDVLEYDQQSSFPTTGETGKIYVAQDTNKTYRWSGTAYVEISPSLALGETSSTAYRGDRGKTAYDHASAKGSAFASGLYKITTNSEGHVTAATAVAKADITGLGIPGSDTNTHRPIQVNGTEVLGNNTTALNLKAGSNVSVTNSSGTVTIAATDTTYSDATTTASGLMSSSDKTKLNGIATGAEVNQNAFSNVVVGSTTISADSKTDTLTLAAGSNITITPDATNDKVTIAATDTTYTAATAAPENIATSGAQGSSTNYARQDHTHGIALATGDSNGQVKIAGSNVSVKGLGSAAYTNSTAYAAASHTHSGDAIVGGYLNIHPENSPVLIPFMNNDIAYLLKRGGSATVKYDSTTQSVDLTSVFDASPSYWAINPTGVTTITIELILHKQFTWTNIIYVDFGASGWRSTTVKIEVMNSNYSGDTWTQKYNNTSNSSGHCYVTTSHTPSGASNAGGGFNKIRFTFSGWANQTIFRIAQLGVYNYGSAGLRETFLPKDGGPIFGSIYPNSNNGANLGTTSQYFSNAYITNINGVAVGSSPKFTDTNTWRPVSDSVSSTSSSDCASSKAVKTAYDLANDKVSCTTANVKSALGTGSGTSKYLREDGSWVTPPDNNTHRPIQVNSTEILGNNTTALNLKAGSNISVTNSSGTVTIAATDTTYSSKSAASGGTDVSLVTTGEKYTWNNKSNLTIGTSSTTAAAGNHTHGLSIATSSGTNAITLAASTKYQLTAGGSTYIFTTPPNTTYSVATTSANGLMSSDDKTKLNGIATGATKNTVSDSLTDTSTTNALSAAKGKKLNDDLTSANGAIQELNSKINTYNLSSVDSLSLLESSLLTYAQSLNMGDYRVVNFHANWITVNGFKSGQCYQGNLHVIYKATNALYFSIIFESAEDEPPVWMNYENGTWTIDTLVLNSKTTPIEILENTDLNTLTTPGNYYSPNTSRTPTLSNAPFETSAFTLQVKERGNYIDQIAQAHSVVKVRGNSSSGFSDWEELVLDSNLLKIRSPENYTNDILVDALNVDGTVVFSGSGSGYTGTVPDNTYKYGVFTVYKRYSTYTVIAVGANQHIAINKYDSVWQGWQELALNSNIATQDIGTFSSLASLENALVTLNSNMNSYQFKNVKFATSSAFGKFSSTTYIGTVSRFSAARMHCEFHKSSGTVDGPVIGKYNDSWTWDKFGLNSQTTSEAIFSNSVELYSVDLNNVTTPGIYKCTSAANAGTLSHCPCSSAFSMMILTRTNAITQFIIGPSKMWSRHGTSAGIASSPWVVFEGTVVS